MGAGNPRSRTCRPTDDGDAMEVREVGRITDHPRAAVVVRRRKVPIPPRRKAKAVVDTWGKARDV